MEILDIVSFLAVVQSGSITAAANSQYITQSALSRRIKHLEVELGLELFERGKGFRSVQLSSQGEVFVHIAKKWIELWNETKSITTRSAKIQVRISAMGSIQYHLMMPCYQRLLELYPNLDLNISGQHPPAAYNMVKHNELDAAFVGWPQFSEAVRFFPVLSEKLLIVSRGDYPEKLSPQYLDPLKEIRFTWTPECESWRSYWCGSTVPRIILDDFRLLKPMMGPGSWCVIPATAAVELLNSPGFVCHSISNPPPERKIYCITSKNNIVPAWIPALIDIMRGYVEGNKNVTLLS